MKFNKFVWELYRKSEQGVKNVRRFKRLTHKFIEPSNNSFYLYPPNDTIAEYPAGEIHIDLCNLVRHASAQEKISSLDNANNYYHDILIKEGLPIEVVDIKGKKEVGYIFGEDESEWCNWVADISLGLYLAHPEFFLPYNFQTKFNQLEEIHHEFGIPLPPVPGRGQKEARALYYLAINQAWQEFRRDHELTPAEMGAFLYDFAPQFTTAIDAADLPSPSKVWLVTGTADDYDILDKSNDHAMRYWGGDPRIRRGDIVLIYCVAPHKCIDTVWRACSDGFIDPFFYYGGGIWLTRRVKTVPITYAEMQHHPLLGQKPALKASFRGPSGKTPFTVEEYEALLEIMAGKGQDLSPLSRIPRSDYHLPEHLYTERDVEMQLIEPFLQRLGYRDTDWIRQMPVKMGRGQRNYPDYVLGAKTKPGEESAQMVLEAKYKLSAQREYNEAFIQMKSYALRLQCQVMALAALEGVWAWPADLDADRNAGLHKTWAELAHPDHFHEMLCLIGKDAVLRTQRSLRKGTRKS